MSQWYFKDLPKMNGLERGPSPSLLAAEIVILMVVE